MDIDVQMYNLYIQIIKLYRQLINQLKQIINMYIQIILLCINKLINCPNRLIFRLLVFCFRIFSLFIVIFFIFFISEHKLHIEVCFWTHMGCNSLKCRQYYCFGDCLRVGCASLWYMYLQMFIILTVWLTHMCIVQCPKVSYLLLWPKTCRLVFKLNVLPLFVVRIYCLNPTYPVLGFCKVLTVSLTVFPLHLNLM